MVDTQIQRGGRGVHGAQVHDGSSCIVAVDAVGPHGFSGGACLAVAHLVNQVVAAGAVDSGQAQDDWRRCPAPNQFLGFRQDPSGRGARGNSGVLVDPAAGRICVNGSGGDQQESPGGHLIARQGVEHPPCSNQVGTTVGIFAALGRGWSEDDDIGAGINRRQRGGVIGQVHPVCGECSGQHFGPASPRSDVVPGGREAQARLGAEIPGTDNEDLHLAGGRKPARAMASAYAATISSNHACCFSAEPRKARSAVERTS